MAGWILLLCRFGDLSLWGFVGLGDLGVWWKVVFLCWFWVDLVGVPAGWCECCGVIS